MVYGLYQRLLKEKDLVDFDDVLFQVSPSRGQLAPKLRPQRDKPE